MQGASLVKYANVSTGPLLCLKSPGKQRTIAHCSRAGGIFPRGRLPSHVCKHRLIWGILPTLNDPFLILRFASGSGVCIYKAKQRIFWKSKSFPILATLRMQIFLARGAFILTTSCYFQYNNGYEFIIRAKFQNKDFKTTCHFTHGTWDKWLSSGSFNSTAGKTEIIKIPIA